MRRHIFSINSGRSGSEYLARVLDTAANGSAFHEPKPDGAGRYITRFPATQPSLMQRLLYVPMYARRYAKVRAIRRTAQALPAGHAYIETNHMFIFSFYDVVMNHLRNVEVVLLRRYLPAAVRSFIQLDHFTPECPYTAFWFPSTDHPSSAGVALGPSRDLDQVDQIIAYLIDVEARARRFMERFPAAKVVEVRLGELNQIDRVRALFAALGLEETEQTARVVGEVVNDKPEHKKRVGRTVSLEFCQERIEQYLAKCAARGIALPPLPQLDPVAGVR